jgi:hypothetical protein
MSVDCPTCKSLWEEFSEAVKSHAAILSKFRLAQLVEHDSGRLAALESLSVAAADRRDKARMAYREHEVTHQEGTKTQTA